jgi:hypothetical protein
MIKRFRHYIDESPIINTYHTKDVMKTASDSVRTALKKIRNIQILVAITTTITMLKMEIIIISEKIHQVDLKNYPLLIEIIIK